MALTQKQQAFADALLAGKKRKEAAICAGYSPATASQMAAKIMQNPQVQEYLKQVNGAVEEMAGKAVANARTEMPESVAGLITDPRAILVRLMNSNDPDMALNAAKALMPYVHGRIAPAGKKEDKAQAAKATASSASKFGTLDNQLNGQRPS